MHACTKGEYMNPEKTLGTATYPTFGEAAFDSNKVGVGNQISGGFNNLVGNLKGIKPVAGYEGVWTDAFSQLIAIEAQLRTAATGKPLV